MPFVPQPQHVAGPAGTRERTANDATVGSRSAFRRRWFRSVLVAEAAGFAVPALVGLAAWRAGLDGFTFTLLIVAAGAVEGLGLGIGQSRALETRLPGTRRSWIAATSLGAAAAWALGMTPSTLFDLGVPTWAAVVAAPFIGVGVLASLGAAQWLVLRHRLRRAWRWVPLNALSWMVGLPATFLFPALVPNGSPAWTYVVAWLGAGLCMAAIVAACGAYLMDRLLNNLQ